MAKAKATSPTSTAKKSKSRPALLAYQRSLSPTDGVFLAVGADGAQPIEIRLKTTLGTQSQFAEITGKNMEYGNPQRVEAASLPLDCHQLRIDWQLAVIPAVLAPHSCELPDWRDRLKNFARNYALRDGFAELGRRYAANIANGRWAFKNRLFASQFSITVTASSYPADYTQTPEIERFKFDAFAYPLSEFSNDDNVERLGTLIASALSGSRPLLRLAVSGTLDIGNGANVYPSQEFVEPDKEQTAIGKVLYGVPYQGMARCAAYHEQKVGAALRTIDTWHSGLSDDDRPIVEQGKPLPVNPYAQDRDAHAVVRSRESRTDLYTILENHLTELTEGLEAQTLSDQNWEQAHFLAANLVRGGVFGMKEDKPAKAKNAGQTDAEAEAAD